jgi:hypothetical protein
LPFLALRGCFYLAPVGSAAKGQGPFCKKGFFEPALLLDFFSYAEAALLLDFFSYAEAALLLDFSSYAEAP